MLADDCLMIPYQTGNVFISHSNTRNVSRSKEKFARRNWHLTILYWFPIKINKFKFKKKRNWHLGINSASISIFEKFSYMQNLGVT